MAEKEPENQSDNNKQASPQPAQGEALTGQLGKNYSINFNKNFDKLSSDFANIYEVQQTTALADTDKEYQKYAMVFDKSFPINSEAIRVHKRAEALENRLPFIYDSGIVKLTKQKTENFCIIFGAPRAKSLREIFTDSPATETVLMNVLIPQISTVLTFLTDYDICHGNLNIDNIFYDPASQKLYFGECFSAPSGYSQPVLFEPITRAICDSAGKGDKDLSADYFAMGVAIVFMLTGKLPMNDFKDSKILETRLLKNSFITYTSHIKKASTQTMELLRGLLSDNNERRWGKDQLDGWLRKKISQTVSTPTKEAMRGVMFLDTEYFNCRSLVDAIYTNFEKAKVAIRVNDMARWLRHGLLNNDMADQFEDLQSTKKMVENATLDDDEVYKIMAILDPYGPLRHSGFTLNIYGLGTFLANAYAKQKREEIQVIGNIFNSGLLGFWLKLIHVASNEEDPRYDRLIWEPKREAKQIRNGNIGFGMERFLYDANPTLPCLSPILKNYYVTDLRDMLLALDEYARDHGSNDDEIVDRHLAAFIASKIDLRDEIIIKKIADFEKISRDPNVIMLAFLVTAQVQARVKDLTHLSAWITKKVKNVLDSLHGSTTKKDMHKALERMSTEGDLNEIMNLVTNPGYLKRDDFSFKEARRYYTELGNHINFLKSQENNERSAYEMGLRVAVIIGYTVLIGTIMFSLINI